MNCREDYHKFTYLHMPHMTFKYGHLMVSKLLMGKDDFIKDLRSTWNTIRIENVRQRSEAPNFEIDMIDFNIEQTGIILSIPEAKEKLEAVYIGIIYDKNGSFRYFTYEIGEGRSEEDTVYFLCELTPAKKRYNYGFYLEKDKDVFIKKISELLVFDLL